MSNLSSRLRMIHWLAIALMFYFIAIMLTKASIEPQLQIVSWKLGNATISAFVGYWIDRNLFMVKLDENSSPLIHIRRAIIIAATMMSVGLGL